MAFLKLCTDDKLINILHKVFRANIVRVPEARLQPLSVLAVTPDKPHFWGNLNELIETPLDNPGAAIQESPMADVSGKRSKNVDLDLGLQILQGFLQGFNLPSAAISSKFSGARTVSFSFQEVNRSYISPGKLGNLLQGQALEANNSSNAIFFGKEAQLLVVDSVITSKDFSIKVEKFNSTGFSLDVPAIEKLIGQASGKVQVTSASGLDLSFHGPTPLSFAFTCIECIPDAAGRISIKPSSATTHFAPGQPPEPELITETPAMIELN